MNSRSRQLFKYVFPSILSTVSIFLFTIVDGVFVGRGVGTDGLGAVNLAFPYVMVFTAVVMLTTIGGLTITAIRLGRGDKEGANEAFSSSVLITLLICVVLCLVGLLFTEPIARLMGANDHFLDLTCEYLYWYCVFLIPCGMCSCLNGFCRNDGAPGLVSAATVVCTSLNIFGDWYLIFPLQMGLKGAAIATGAAQSIGFLIVLTYFLRETGTLRFKPRAIRRAVLGKIFLRGLPECVSQFSAPVCTILTNIMLGSMLGNDAVNAYSVISYAACFSIAVFVGVAEGIQPLLGNCYGARKEDDLRYYFKAGLWISAIGSFVIASVMLIIWPGICTIFDVDEAARISSTHAMPRYVWGFVIQSFNVIISAYLYSTTRTRQALWINLCRSLLVNAPVILLLPRLFGPDAIWFTFPVYEALVLVLAVILLKKADRNGIVSAAE